MALEIRRFILKIGLKIFNTANFRVYFLGRKGYQDDGCAYVIRGLELYGEIVYGFAFSAGRAFEP
jgi:hypothetical protein